MRGPLAGGRGPSQVCITPTGLAASGVLLRPHAVREMVSEDFFFSYRAAAVFVVTLSAVEIVLGTALLAGWAPLAMSSVAAGLLLAFTVVNLRGDTSGSCNCFGITAPIRGTRLSTFLRNAMLMAVAVYGTVSAAVEPPRVAGVRWHLFLAAGGILMFGVTIILYALAAFPGRRQSQ